MIGSNYMQWLGVSKHMQTLQWCPEVGSVGICGSTAKHAGFAIVSGGGTHAYINVFVLEMCGSVSKYFLHEVLLLCSVPSMLCWC